MQKEILAPGILKFDFPKEISNKILNVCKKDNIAWYESGIVQYKSGTNINIPNINIRTSKQIHLTEINEDLEKQVNSEISRALFVYKTMFNINIENNEEFSLLKYEIGEKFDYHFDTTIKSYRTVSIIVYLNPEEYEGGETHFKYFDLNIKPNKSSILVFPSNYPYKHASLPVTSGTKYVIVNWYNDLHKGTIKNLDILAEAKIKNDKIREIINNNDK